MEEDKVLAAAEKMDNIEDLRLLVKTLAAGLYASGLFCKKCGGAYILHIVDI